MLKYEAIEGKCTREEYEKSIREAKRKAGEMKTCHHCGKVVKDGRVTFRIGFMPKLTITPFKFCSKVTALI